MAFAPIFAIMSSPTGVKPDRLLTDRRFCVGNRIYDNQKG